MAVHYLGDNGPDGMCLGTGTSEKIAFYGSTPTAQLTLTALTTASTLSVAVTSIQQIIARLQSIGLFG